MDNKIKNNLKSIMKLFCFIVIPILMALGRVLDEILFNNGGYDIRLWFFLPLFAGIFISIYLVRYFNKGFGYIAGLAVVFTILLVIFNFLNERYPLGFYAQHTRERQIELDRAKEIEAPFVESLRALFEDDTLSYHKSLDSIKLILKTQGKKAANSYLRQQVIELKSQRDYTDSTEMIIESIRKKKPVQYSKNELEIVSINNSINRNEKFSSPSGTTETVSFNKNGPSVPTTKIYLVPGQVIRLRSTADCFAGGSKYYIPANQWIQCPVIVEGHLDIEGAGKKGTLTIEVL